MQARGLGRARDAVGSLPSIPANRCFASLILSHLSLSRGHSSLMSSKMAEPPAIPLKRSRRRKVAPTAMEVMEARLRVLGPLIASTEGRTDLNSKQRIRRDKHIWEKSQIEIRMEACNNGLTFAQAVSADVQPPVTAQQNEIPAALSIHPMGLRSTNSLIPQKNARSIVATNGSVRKPPAKPFTGTNRPSPQSVPRQDLPMTLPLRPSPSNKRGRGRDLIILPSAASGGVPEPSPMYVSLATLPPEVSSVPQHLLLVLDLNGTLLYRPNRNQPFHFIERPSTQQFLAFAFANFSVMIWSSAQPENVDRMCDKLFSRESRQRLVAVWGRDRLGLSEADSKKRVQVYKRLERVWSDPQIQGRHPLASEGKGWHQGNTVLIDDSVEKSRSEPHNFLEVPEFRGHEGEDLDLLKEVAEYLAILRMQTNVSSYICRNPLLRRSPLNQHEGVVSSAKINGQPPLLPRTADFVK